MGGKVARKGALAAGWSSSEPEKLGPVWLLLHKPASILRGGVL